MRRIPCFALAAVALALAGCSQLSALAPVGGQHLAEVRNAAIDVIVEEGIVIGEAPVCVEEDGAVTCTGATDDGDTIGVVSTAQDPDSVLVTAGLRTVYDGSITAVLDRAARTS